MIVIEFGPLYIDIALYLAFVIVRDQDIPCCQVSVNKGLAGQVDHSRGHLSTVAQESVGIYIHSSFIWSHVEEVPPKVSLLEYLQN